MGQHHLRHPQTPCFGDGPTQRLLAKALALVLGVDHDAPDPQFIGGFVGVQAAFPQEQKAHRRVTAVQPKRPPSAVVRGLRQRFGHGRHKAGLIWRDIQCDQSIDVAGHDGANVELLARRHQIGCNFGGAKPHLGRPRMGLQTFAMGQLSSDGPQDLRARRTHLDQAAALLEVVNPQWRRKARRA